MSEPYSEKNKPKQNRYKNDWNEDGIMCMMNEGLLLSVLSLVPVCSCSLLLSVMSSHDAMSNDEVQIDWKQSCGSTIFENGKPEPFWKGKPEL